MADFFNPTPGFAPPPDMLAAYLRGQMAPGIVQGQQQQLQSGALSLEQARLALQNQQVSQQIAFGALRDEGYNVGTQAGTAPAGAQNPVRASSTGGIVNGPQGSVTGPMRTGPTQASGSYSGTYGGAPSVGGGILGRSPNTNAALAVLWNRDPFAAATEARNYQMENARLAWATDNSVGGEATLRQLATSIDAPNIVARNIGQLGPLWTQAAFKSGVDARALNDPDPVTRAAAVNRVAASIYNQKAISIGAPTISAPTRLQYQQAGNQGVAVDPTGEKPPVVFGSQPGYTNQTYTDQSGQQHLRTVETAPGSTLPPSLFGQNAGVSPRGGGPGSVVGDQNLGYVQPDKEQYNAAKNAQLMLTSKDQLANFDNNGIGLSPSARTLVIQALTKEDTSNLDQLMLQEGLRHKLTSDEQAYMTALTPFLQAAGHSWGQAGIGRLTPSMARQMFETLAPIDPTNPQVASMVEHNRQNLFGSALQEAGGARETPLYKPSLGSEYDKLINQAQSPASQSPKSVTMQDVNAYAVKHNLSAAAALAHVKANGFTVSQ